MLDNDNDDYNDNINIIDVNKVNEKNNQIYILKTLSNLPPDIKVTTISVTFDMDIKFDINNIRKIIETKSNEITTIKYAINNTKYVRSLYPYKYLKLKNKNKNKKRNKRFSDEVTLIIDANEINKYLNDTNIKLFCNGAVQVSGCYSYDHFKNCIEIVFKNLLKDKYIRENNKFVLKNMINVNKITMDNIINFKINLINTGFNTGFNIDRDKLNKLCISKNISCSYEPTIYAGVKINYKYEFKDDKHDYSKYISVVVFERGYVMINGGSYKNQIVKTYKFIMDLLFNNYELLIQKSPMNHIKVN